MKRRNFIKTVAATAIAGAASTDKLFAFAENTLDTNLQNATNERKYWTSLLYKISQPVLSNMAKGELRKNMTVEVSPTWDGRDKAVTYMECFGRLISGLAPWLTLPQDNTQEGRQRKQLQEWALQSYTHSVDPASADYLLWRNEGQPLVDSAYFSNALIRAPKQLWEPLEENTKKRIIAELKQLRRVKPPYTNWLLFAAMNEAFLMMIGEDYDPMRIDLTIKKMEEWYVGDGWYADGTRFHFDYYNSFVIHPMLLEILEVMVKLDKVNKKTYEQALKRCQRYAEHLERLISPEGTFPPFGRSLTYRTGAFQPLSLLAWKKQLPEKLSEGQVRAALTAVHQSIFSNPTNFTKDGYLTIGFAGHQPELGDWYSNNGSMYITSESFLPLALAASDTFWTTEKEDWTAKKAYSNSRFNKDYPVEY